MDISLRFALACAVLQGVLNVGMRIFNLKRKDDSRIYVTIFYVFSAFFIGGFAFFSKKLLMPEIRSLSPYVLNLILMVFLNGIGIIFIFESLKRLEVSVFTVLFSSNVMITLLASRFLLKEKINELQYFGLIFLFLGVWMLCYEKGTLLKNLKKAWPIWISSPCMGTAIVNTKYLLTEPSPFNPYSYSVLSFLLTALFIFLTNPVKIGRGFGNFVDTYFLKWMFSLSFIHALMLIFLYKALSSSESNSVQVAGVMASSVFFGVILATLFLEEKKGFLKKFLAMMVTFIGLWLIK